MKTLSEVCAELFECMLIFKGLSPGNRPDHETLRRKIYAIFDKQERELQENKIRKESYELAKFAMAALVDEIILNSDWEYRREWQADTLQAALFNTNIAGEQFFTKLESLGPDDTAILEIYYHCLCLGFLGAHKNQKGLLLGLKEMCLKKLPHLDRNSPSKLTPPAYESHYRGEKVISEIPPILWIILPVGAFILIYLLFSFLINQEVWVLLEQLHL
jgi:type IV/VI secretion system ImpK/VasF family protein